MKILHWIDDYEIGKFALEILSLSAFNHVNQIII